MNAAEVLIRCLENEGVRYIFGIPGEENLEVMKALQGQDTIKFITVRHEQGAAFMADMVGRLTGKAGICISTLGPGATAPLIAITAQVGTERMHLTSHQYLDLVSMFEPITKRSKEIVRPDSVNEIVRAMTDMARKKIGALIVVERQTGLGDVIETGTRVDAEISAPLIENIFEPNTPLHDGAMIIRNRRINAAACAARVLGGLICVCLIPRLRVLSRFCMYRGAINKVLNAAQADKPVAREAAEKASRLTHQSDAAFSVTVLLASIVAFAFVRTFTLPVQLLVRVLIVLIIAAVLGEIVHLLEVTWPNPVSRVLLAPQVWLEKLLVREPHTQMVEVALCAYNAALENDR